MLVTATHITTGGDEATSGTSFNTASISPTANRLVVIGVHSHEGGGDGNPDVPTLSGAGMTWTQIGTVRGIGDTSHRITLFRALSSSPGSGAVTISFGTSQDEVFWTVTEFNNVDTTGTNGANAVVQSAFVASSSAGTGSSVTLGAFSHGNNATFGFALQQGSTAMTPGSGFTELSEYNVGLFDTIHTEFKNSNDTSVDTSWVPDSNNWLAAALEIKAKTFVPRVIMI